MSYVLQLNYSFNRLKSSFLNMELYLDAAFNQDWTIDLEMIRSSLYEMQIIKNV
jgi:hypothetical protein